MAGSVDRCIVRDRQTVMQTAKQRGRQTVYQSRSGDRLFGAGDHIGLVVDLEGQSGQTEWTEGRDRAEVTRLSVQTSSSCCGGKSESEELSGKTRISVTHPAPNTSV